MTARTIPSLLLALEREPDLLRAPGAWRWPVGAEFPASRALQRWQLSRSEQFAPSDTHTVCGWKGTASDHPESCDHRGAMTDPTSPNADQIRHWNELNGDRWAALQGRLDAQLDPIGLAAMERLALPSSARVLDVGCGCGSTTLELARRATPGGAATGVDISGPLLARAIERASEGAVANARFVQADAQTFAFEEGAYDAVFSRFGVMFFADPVAAFANLRRALAPGGALAFVCWRDAKENAWVTVPMRAARPFFEAPAPPVPGAPGPFSLADRERLEAVLTAAGFAEISVEAVDPQLRLGGGSDLDGTVDFVLEIGPTATLLRGQSSPVDAVRAALRVALAPYQTDDGVTLGGAVWIVRAKRAAGA